MLQAKETGLELKKRVWVDCYEDIARRFAFLGWPWRSKQSIRHGLWAWRGRPVLVEAPEWAWRMVKRDAVCRKALGEE